MCCQRMPLAPRRIGHRTMRLPSCLTASMDLMLGSSDLAAVRRGGGFFSPKNSYDVNNAYIIYHIKVTTDRDGAPTEFYVF